MTDYHSAAVKTGTVSAQRVRAALFAGLFTVPYAAVLFWFQVIDVYHRHFSEIGWLVLAYNACRLHLLLLSVLDRGSRGRRTVTSGGEKRIS